MRATISVLSVFHFPSSLLNFVQFCHLLKTQLPEARCLYLLVRLALCLNGDLVASLEEVVKNLLKGSDVFFGLIFGEEARVVNVVFVLVRWQAHVLFHEFHLHHIARDKGRLVSLLA